MKKLVGTDKWAFVAIEGVLPNDDKRFPVRVCPGGVAINVIDKVYSEVFLEVSPQFLIWLKMEVERAAQKTET